MSIGRKFPGAPLCSSKDKSNTSSDDLEKLRQKRQEILNRRKAPIDMTASAKEAAKAAANAPQSESEGGISLERPSILQERVQAKEAARAAEEAQEATGVSSKSVSGKKEPAVDYTQNYDHENELQIPNRIGFGTMSWGDPSRGYVKASKKKKRDKSKFSTKDLREAYSTLMNGGIKFIDVSENYGTAETLIGRFAEDGTATNEEPILTSGLTANPYEQFVKTGGRSGIRIGPASVVRALEESCARMEASNVELYHLNPNRFSYVGGRAALLTGLVQALDRGSTNHVGVRNVYRPRTLRKLQRSLNDRGASLSTNMFAFSLLDRTALKMGTISACKDLGIVPVAHTPLYGGLASGRYTAQNPTGGGRGTKYSFKTLDPLLPLHNAQARVATKVKDRLKREARENRERRSRNYQQSPMIKNQDITPMQVAINYVVAKGAVPIPGIKNKEEAEELLGCLGWGLSEEEVAILDQAADLCGK